MVKRMIPMIVTAALGLTLAGCYENEPGPAGGGGGNPSGTAIDLDNAAVIDRGAPGFVYRDGDAFYDGLKGIDRGAP